MLLSSCAVGDPAGNRPPAPNELALHEMGEPRKCLVKEAGLNSPVYEPGSSIAQSWLLFTREEEEEGCDEEDGRAMGCE